MTPSTRRSYTQTLHRLLRALGARTPLTTLTPDHVARAFTTAWPDAAPKTWNRHRAAVRSFTDWTSAPPRAWLETDLSSSLPRHRESGAPRTPLHPDEFARLLARPDIPLRERALWSLLYESSTTIAEALALNVEDLNVEDLAPDRLPAAADLLLGLAAGRTRGPVFLSDRRPAPSRTPGPADLCPDTGRRRLSYERAEYVFKQKTKPLDPSGRGYTLHQLRHARPR
ncbi:site-specific integrase [Actinocorallia populi]|uniref:site-specific integrase n=1 Tax=Actinocorallia populi TaxID=2079200 RepID=UPI0038BBA952